jgi:hypothetical protein
MTAIVTYLIDEWSFNPESGDLPAYPFVPEHGIAESGTDVGIIMGILIAMLLCFVTISSIVENRRTTHKGGA